MVQNVPRPTLLVEIRLGVPALVNHRQKTGRKMIKVGNHPHLVKRMRKENQDLNGSFML